ncbi:MAG: hypothetical protein OXC31_14470, partial [Spirochaetaceae bacterium]|nr:hypothetical protein [Spirochaetaceae bacterium]
MSADATPLMRPDAGLAKPMRIVLFLLLAVLCLLAVSMIGRFGRGDRSTGYEPPEPRLPRAAAPRPPPGIQGGGRAPRGTHPATTP